MQNKKIKISIKKPVHTFSDQQYMIMQQKFKSIVDETVRLVSYSNVSVIKFKEFTICLNNIYDAYCYITDTSIASISTSYEQKYKYYINMIDMMIKSYFLTVSNGKTEQIIQKVNIIKSLYTQQFLYIKKMDEEYSKMVAEFKWKHKQYFEG